MNSSINVDKGGMNYTDVICDKGNCFGHLSTFFSTLSGASSDSPRATTN